MRHDAFFIGREFQCDARVFRCTDVGIRTVVAIRVDRIAITTSTDGQMTTRVLSGTESGKEGWFDGPPYAVAELVFVETDFEGCEPV